MWDVGLQVRERKMEMRGGLCIHSQQNWLSVEKRYIMSDAEVGRVFLGLCGL
jgi:hypothetical protein